MRPFALSLLMACAAGAGWGVAAADAQSSSIPFETHAAFFSTETKQAKPLDPQAFVKDAAAPAATGPQGIKHAAGFRPAFIGTDASSDPVYNADGKSLGFTLGAWLGPQGSVMMERSEPGMTVTVSLRHLLPNAQYSLFENHFDQNPVGFTALGWHRDVELVPNRCLRRRQGHGEDAHAADARQRRSRHLRQ